MKNHRLCILAIAILFGLPMAANGQPHGTPGPGVHDIDSLLSEHPLPKEQPFRSDVIAWDSTSSVHLTQIGAGIEMHHHTSHDENVWIVRGAGRLMLGEMQIKVKAGQVVHIPHQVPHSFQNLGAQPAVVISVFSPGFDGKDRVHEDRVGK